MDAVALQEERQSLTSAELCSEMRFLDRKYLRVVLLNAQRWTIKARHKFAGGLLGACTMVD